MSPAKKKTKKKPAAARRPKAASKKKSTPRKKATSKKKTAPKKKAAAKKTAPAKKKSAAKKKAVSKKASAPKKGAAAKQKPASKAASRKAGSARSGGKSRANAVPVGVHPRFGQKFECFSCKAKFYDMGKEDPICPKCETDQRDDVSLLPKPAGATAAKTRKAAARPMAPLLDDDESPAQSASEDEDLAGMESRARSGEGFFDDAAVATEETEETEGD